MWIFVNFGLNSFRLEESFGGGSVYPELKFHTAETHFDISIAAKAIFSSRAGTIVEPFPSFFLKK